MKGRKKTFLAIVAGLVQLESWCPPFTFFAVGRELHFQKQVAFTAICIRALFSTVGSLYLRWKISKDPFRGQVVPCHARLEPHDFSLRTATIVPQKSVKKYDLGYLDEKVLWGDIWGEILAVPLLLMVMRFLGTFAVMTCMLNYMFYIQQHPLVHIYLFGKNERFQRPFKRTLCFFGEPFAVGPRYLVTPTPTVVESTPLETLIARQRACGRYRGMPWCSSPITQRLKANDLTADDEEWPGARAEGACKIRSGPDLGSWNATLHFPEGPGAPDYLQALYVGTFADRAEAAAAAREARAVFAEAAAGALDRSRAGARTEFFAESTQRPAAWLRRGRRPCAACGRPGRRRRCGRCRGRAGPYYCDRRCQARHWPAHKAGCRREEKKELEV